MPLNDTLFLFRGNSEHSKSVSFYLKSVTFNLKAVNVPVVSKHVLKPNRMPGQSIGACPPLGMRLQKFLATYLTLLPEEEKGMFQSHLYLFLNKETK